MFKETLNGIIERTQGALAAMILGTDGIAVEKVLRPEGSRAKLDAVAAEFTTLVRTAQRAGVDTALGRLNELVVTLDGMQILVRLFNEEYFILLAVKPDGDVGRGRFELRKAELALAHEFVV